MPFRDDTGINHLYKPDLRWTDTASRNKIPLAIEGPAKGTPVVPIDQRITKHHRVQPQNLKSALKPLGSYSRSVNANK